MVLKKMEVIDNSRMKRTNLIFIIGAEAKNDRLYLQDLCENGINSKVII